MLMMSSSRLPGDDPRISLQMTGSRHCRRLRLGISWLRGSQGCSIPVGIQVVFEKSKSSDVNWWRVQRDEIVRIGIMQGIVLEGASE